MTRSFPVLVLALLAACASPSSRANPAQAVEFRAPELAAAPAVPEAPAAPAPAVEPSPAPPPPASAWDFYRERYDADGDGRITREEYTRSDAGFKHVDANMDGVLSVEDFGKRWDGEPRTGGRTLSYGAGAPPVGAPAPSFRLPTTTGEWIDLARFRGQKPVVLVFGSFT